MPNSIISQITKKIHTFEQIYKIFFIILIYIIDNALLFMLYLESIMVNFTQK